MAETRPIPDVLLERYAAGDLAPKERRRIEAQLEASPALKKRLEELEAERRAFLAAEPKERFAHLVVTRLAHQGAPPRRRPLWAWLLLPSGAAAAAVLVVAVGYSQLVADKTSITNAPPRPPDGYAAPATEGVPVEAAPAAVPPAQPTGTPPLEAAAKEPAAWREVPAKQDPAAPEPADDKPMGGAGGGALERQKHDKRAPRDETKARADLDDLGGRRRGAEKDRSEPPPPPAPDAKPKTAPKPAAAEPKSEPQRTPAPTDQPAPATQQPAQQGQLAAKDTGQATTATPAPAAPPPTAGQAPRGSTKTEAKKTSEREAAEERPRRAAPGSGSGSGEGRAADAAGPPPSEASSRASNPTPSPASSQGATSAAEAVASADERDSGDAAEQAPAAAPRLSNLRLALAGKAVRSGQDVKGGSTIDLAFELSAPGHVVVIGVRGKRAKVLATRPLGAGPSSLALKLDAAAGPTPERLVVVVASVPFAAQEALKPLQEGEPPLPARLGAAAAYRELVVVVVP